MSLRQLAPRLLLLAVLFGTAGLLLGNWFLSNRPEARYRAGVAAIERADFERAEALADRLERSGSFDWANLLRGRVLLAQTRAGKALTAFAKIKDRGKIRREGAFYSGEAKLQLGQLREAEEAFLFVLSEEPDHVDAHRHLSVLYYDQGDGARSVEQLEEVVRLDPSDARPHALLGIIYSQNDRHTLAVDEFRKALAGGLPEPLWTDTQIGLGESLVKLFRYEEAIDSVKGIDTVRAGLVRAASLTRMNRFAEAHAELDAAEAKEPDDPALLRQRGVTLLAEDRTAEAIPFLERAASLEPGDYTGQFQLGEALALAGHSERAAGQRKRVEEIRQRIREVVELSETASKDTWDAKPRLRLAEIWKDLGKPELSRMWSKAAAACRE